MPWDADSPEAVAALNAPAQLAAGVLNLELVAAALSDWLEPTTLAIATAVVDDTIAQLTAVRASLPQG